MSLIGRRQGCLPCSALMDQHRHVLQGDKILNGLYRIGRDARTSGEQNHRISLPFRFVEESDVASLDVVFYDRIGVRKTGDKEKREGKFNLRAHELESK